MRIFKKRVAVLLAALMLLSAFSIVAFADSVSGPVGATPDQATPGEATPGETTPEETTAPAESTEATTQAQETTPDQTPVWTVAGNLPMLGGDWDPSNMDNALTEGENNIWHIRWIHVPKGEYEFKITNGTWDEAYGLGSDNFYVRITEDESDLWIKFNADTKEITVEGNYVTTERPVEEVVAGYYVVGSAGLCGKDWVNKADPATLMFKGEDGNYYKDFTNIAAGEYSFKVIYVNELLLLLRTARTVRKPLQLLYTLILLRLLRSSPT